MMSVFDNDGEGSEYSPSLSANCVQSVVTINPTPHRPKALTTSLLSVDLNKRRQNSFRNNATSQSSTSVATHSITSNFGGNNETGYNTTTLVATCNGGSNGRIHLATIFEGHGENDARDEISRVVGMKYSSKEDDCSNSPSFATVCIASVQSKTSAVILALDMEGKLYANHFEIEESTGTANNNYLFDMELCVNNERDGSDQNSPKRGRRSKVPTSMQSDTGGHLFTSMNTLTARIESTPATDGKSQLSGKSSQESSCSTPQQMGRKRKAATPSKPDEGQAVYAVASSLKESHLLPSQTPPVVISLSFYDEDDPDYASNLKEASWSKISGLEHVHSPMTCITFASRSSCGNQLWETLVSMMRHEEGQDHLENNIGIVDKGIVLMGFQNGSLYAATVINGQPGHASRMLQLNNHEPFLSLQILRDEFTEPKLICVGVLGTLAIVESDKNGAVKVDVKRLPFHGRLCSLACVGNHKHDLNCNDLSLIATNDMGKTHLYQLSFKCEESNERKKGNLQLLNVFRVPISHGNASIGTRALEFVWSSSSGKVSLMRIASDLKMKRETRSKHSILAMLRQNGTLQPRMRTNRTAQETNAVSKYDTVIQTLKAAMEKVGIHSSVDSLEFYSNQATKEVRDAIRIVSLSSSTATPPIQCTINVSKAQGFDMGMKIEKLFASSSWHHSIHTISSSIMRPDSIKDMTPLCYRRTRDGLVKVLYGGSSASLNCQNDSSMHVSMYDFSPFPVYASMSKMLIDNESAGNNAWEESVTLDAKLGMLKFTGRAKRAHMQGAVVPFKLGKKSSVSLAGDVFMPFLKVANIIRVKDVSEDVRNAAENEVQQLMQGAGGRRGLLTKMLEDTICYSHSNASEKVHCCSSSVLLTSSKNIEQYVHDSLDNASVEPIALVLNSHKDTGLCELGFAIGSSVNCSNELMSLVPLMRNSIIRYSQREEDLRLDVFKDECYSRLLSENRAAKIVSEVLSRIDESKSGTCPSALLNKCISLYEIMRTLHFIIG